MVTVKESKSYEVDDKFIGDVLVTAFDGSYGACWYWAIAEDCEDMTLVGIDPVDDKERRERGDWTAVRFHQPDQGPFPKHDFEAKTCIHHVKCWEGHECGFCEEAGRHTWEVTVDKDVLVRGMELVLTGRYCNDQIVRWLRQSLDEGEASMVDADVADCIVQCGLLGEGVYG